MQTIADVPMTTVDEDRRLLIRGFRVRVPGGSPSPPPSSPLSSHLTIDLHDRGWGGLAGGRAKPGRLSGGAGGGSEL